jgi:hypothetical protein
VNLTENLSRQLNAPDLRNLTDKRVNFRSSKEIKTPKLFIMQDFLLAPVLP